LGAGSEVLGTLLQDALAMDTPLQSSRRQALFAAAADARLKIRYLRRLLWLLNAPPTLDQLQTIVVNLRSALEVAEETWPMLLQNIGLGWIVSFLIELQSVKVLSSFEEAEAKWFTRHPLYAAFQKSRSKDSLLGRLSLLLQAQYFVAHFMVLLFGLSKDGARSFTLDEYEAYADLEEWPHKTDPYHAGKAIRDLAPSTLWADGILQLLAPDRHPSFMAQSEVPRIDASFQTCGKDAEWLQDRLSYVIHFIAQAHGTEERRKGHGRPSTTDHANAKQRKNPNARQSRKRRVASLLDDCPEDDDLDYDADQSNQAILASKALACHNDRASMLEWMRVDHYSRAHLDQFFAIGMSPSGLCLSETGNKGAIPVEVLEEAEAIVFVLLLLWIGCGPKAVVEIEVVPSAHDALDRNVVIVTDVSKPAGAIYFRILAPFPEYAEVQAPAEGGCEREEFSILEDRARLAPYLRRLLTTWQPGQPERFRLFQKPAAHYSHWIDRILEAVDSTGHLTESRIANSLYGELRSRTGNDVVAAAMITGQERPEAKVQMYYACRDTARISQLHAAVIDGIKRETDMEFQGQAEAENNFSSLRTLAATYEWPAPEPAFVPAPAGTLFIARRNCPTPETVRGGVSKLLEVLLAEEPPAESPNWIHFFNCMTLFTVWYFGFATGIRAIICPYVHLRDVSPLNQTVFISDKGVLKGKLAWVSPDLHQHMKYYAAFLGTTSLRFSLKYPCWFMTKDGKPQGVRPSTMIRHVQEVLPGYGPAIHRRFVMNALLDSGCPAECVRVWAGHATSGNAPWGPCATLSYPQYRHTLSSYLCPLLKFLGFRALG
jgi:hypothetical protein